MFDIISKYCSKSDCKQINPQPISAFRKTKKSPDGHHAACKACDKEYRLKNRERIAIKKAIDYKENKEAIRKKAKQRYEVNGDTIRAKQVLYNSTHKEEQAAYRAPLAES